MGEHAVHYYDGEDELVALVAAYLAAGLETGDRVIAVATPSRLSDLRRVLEPHLHGATDRLLLLDAHETLDHLVVDGSPDPDRFRSLVAGMLSDAGRGGSPVRAYGEMVGLLWEAGNVPGAMELEGLWNEVLEREPVTLMCGYPTTALHGVSLVDVRRACDLHTVVLPPPSYAPTTGAPNSGGASQGHADVRSEVFVPVAQAVGAARRFVVGVLDAWGLQDLRWDAELIVSELANNAVRHGASPFRVLVNRSGDGVRVGVQDVGVGQPLPRSAAPEDLGGRGMTIVGALSRAWGCESLNDGKFTWAELAVPTA